MKIRDFIKKLLRRNPEDPTGDWVPLFDYNDSGKDILVFARRKRSGMLKFKSKVLTRPGTLSYKLGKVYKINDQLEIVLYGEFIIDEIIDD